MKVIFFTGGGSGGHFLVSKVLIEQMRKTTHHQVFYIGGRNSIEEYLCKKLNIPYFPISTGKFRRYFSWKNFTDLVNIFLGFLQSSMILFQYSQKDSIVVSTGGFVSIPLVFAAFILRKKIYIHEQTTRVGLSNKISSYLAEKIFISFKCSEKYFPQHKVIYSGYPVRPSCFVKSIAEIVIDGLRINLQKNMLFITGGAHGSKFLNDLILKYLSPLKETYFILHQVGKNHIEQFLPYRDKRYLPVDFLGDEIIDIYKLSSLIISRSGAGTVSELLTLQIRSLYIPLRIAQKNEQYFNAKEAEKRCASLIVTEEEMNGSDLISILETFKKKKPQEQCTDQVTKNAESIILDVILK